jgi:hypothetical protein
MADKRIIDLQENISTTSDPGVSYLYDAVPVYDANEASTEKMKRVFSGMYGIPIYNIGSPFINVTVMNGMTVPFVNASGTIKARVCVRDFLASIHIAQPQMITYGIKKSSDPGWTLSINPLALYVEYTNQIYLGVNYVQIRVGYEDESEITRMSIAETYVILTDPMGYFN